MYLIVIAWIYVALMMAVAEATHAQGSLLGAIFTFVLYGVGPVALVVYLLGRGPRRKAREAREAQEAALAAPRPDPLPQAGEGVSRTPPDGGGEAAADAVASVRKET
ncbi:hypothetical protein [Ramlibacter sp.]|uniref:hypothetical protein n=1 Tax=Ramlibacter sp. TaxID=1917967 RepID=UPI003D0DCAF0